MKKTYLKAILLILLVFVSQNSFALDWNITNVTNDNLNIHDIMPVIEDNTYAWRGLNELGKDAIWFWDGHKLNDLSRGLGGYLYGAAIDNGQVVWRRYDFAGIGTIYLWDGENVKKIQDYDIGPFNPYTAYPPSFHALDPSINQNIIAWAEWDGNDYEIKMYDGASIIQITNNDIDDFEPSVWNGQIAFTGMTANEPSTSEVYLWDGQKINQLTNNTLEDWDIHFRNDKIVWTEWAGSGWGFDIFMWDGEKIENISKRQGNDFEPQLYEDDVVWHGIEEGSFDIFLRRDGKIYNLTKSPADEAEPWLWENKIIYHIRPEPGSDFEIQYLQLSSDNGRVLVMDNTVEVSPDVDVFDWKEYPFYLYDDAFVQFEIVGEVYERPDLASPWQNDTNDDSNIALMVDNDFLGWSGQFTMKGDFIKGKAKSINFSQYLQRGFHSLHIMADESPKLSKVRITQLPPDEILIDTNIITNIPGINSQEIKKYSFTLAQDSWVLIEMAGSADAQSFSIPYEDNSNDDDDCLFIIDNEAVSWGDVFSFDGNELKSSPKVSWRKIFLAAGDHSLTLFADMNPKLKSIKISKLESEGVTKAFYPYNANSPDVDQKKIFEIASNFSSDLVISGEAKTRPNLDIPYENQSNDDDDVSLAINDVHQGWNNNYSLDGNILKGNLSNIHLFYPDSETKRTEIIADETPFIYQISAFDDDAQEYLISDFFEPSYNLNIEGVYKTPYFGIMHDVAIGKDVAFAAYHNIDLSVIDVGDTTNPYEINRLVYDDGEGFDVEIKDNYLYLADRNAGIRVFDITDENNPVLVNTFQTYDVATQIYIHENKLFCSDRNGGMLIIDIADPNNLTLLGRFLSDAPINGIAVKGNYAYVANSYKGMVMVDISDPSHPVEKGIYNSPKTWNPGIWDIKIRNEFAYLVCQGYGIQILDISDPLNPLPVSFFALPDGASDMPFPHIVPPLDLTFYKRFALVSNGQEGVFILNIDNPYKPFIVDKIITPGFVYDISIKGRKLYIANDLDGLQIVDIGLLE